MNNPTPHLSPHNSLWRQCLLAACVIPLALSAQAQKFTWSAPVPFAGLNADQILTNFPGTKLVNGLMGNGGPTTVTLSSGAQIIFAAPNTWAGLAGGSGSTTGGSTNLTGNANFDACLNGFYYDNATHTITMSNLVVGKQYSVQLFALDNRGSLSPAGSDRTVNWQDPNDGSDVSATYTMADNAYIVGTFTAANSAEAIQENVLTSSGNFNCLVLRAVGWAPPPSFVVQPANVIGFPTENATFSGLATGDPVPGYYWESGPTGGPYTPLTEGAKYTGTATTALTIHNLASTDTNSMYVLMATNSGGSTMSREATLGVQNRALVGRWLDGSPAGTNLLDVSGYALATNHGAFLINGAANFVFTNDLPPNHTNGLALAFTDVGDTGLAISNSSTFDANYDTTFDNAINYSFSLTCWARGLPNGWSPFISKWGEGRPYASPDGGWQLRADGNGLQSCFTVRSEQRGNFAYGCDTGDNVDDMATTVIPTADGQWHLYVGTFDTASGVRNLYVDGVLAAQETNNVAYDLAPYSHVCIGAKDSSPGNSFGSFSTNLTIFDVRIYNYALSQDFVRTNLYGANPAVVNGQPQPAAVFAGETTQFRAIVGGTVPLAYQWRLNGTNISLLIDPTNFVGENSNVLTILSVTPSDVGSYSVIATNLYGSATSSNAALTIVQRTMVGHWFGGSASLADTSGYRSAGTHDGTPIGNGAYVFTNDAPAGLTGQSLWLSDGASGIEINNSATGDAGYLNTFDDQINSHMTITFWAKGAPSAWSWSPWVSKYGEGPGWQFRTGGANGGNGGPVPCWTVRDNGSGAYNPTNGGGPSWSENGDLDDLHATVSGTAAGGNLGYYDCGDGGWHFYAGTFSAVTGIRNIYVDGTLYGQETGNVKYNLSPTTHVIIGGKESPGGTLGNFSAMEIYDLRILNYDLTTDQVVGMMPDPVITVQPPQSLDAYIGGNAHISATVITHVTPVTNQWQFNGTNLVDGIYGGVIISGSTSSALTMRNVATNIQGVYRLIVSDSHGTVTSGNTTVTVFSIVPPPAGNLVGSWITGAASLADTSGYQPAGRHDGHGVTGTGADATNYGFTNDVPSGWTGQALTLRGNTTIAISNSSTYDLNYANTFDDTITNMTVAIWAKGLPGTWNPFISKYGENGLGWQLRKNGGSSPCWTVQGTGGTVDMSSSSPFPTDGLWHHYAGTFTFDGTNGVRKLYVDGVLSAMQTETAPCALSAEFVPVHRRQRRRWRRLRQLLRWRNLWRAHLRCRDQRGPD